MEGRIWLTGLVFATCDLDTEIMLEKTDAWNLAGKINTTQIIVSNYRCINYKLKEILIMLGMYDRRPNLYKSVQRCFS